MSDTTSNPANRFMEFSGITRQNRDFFLLEFGADYRKACDLQDQFQNLWKPLGTKRDFRGQSHAGALPLQALAHRSFMYGFDTLQSFQIALAWPNMRYAIETILILGKFIADPATATIWNNWKSDKRRYIKTFQNELDINNALPRCGEFRKVLSNINDEYLHPNPLQVLSPANTQMARKDEKTMAVLTTWGGGERYELDGHTLAFIRLFADIVDACGEMIYNLMGENQGKGQFDLREQYEELESDRAKALIKDHSNMKPVLRDFGLWSAKRM